MAYDPYISAEQLAEIGVRKVEKEELFRISDIISLHLHANAETNGMICKETLALMKPTAILINVSRGPLVKDEDLNAAFLRRGLIRIITNRSARSRPSASLTMLC